MQVIKKMDWTIILYSQRPKSGPIPLIYTSLISNGLLDEVLGGRTLISIGDGKADAIG